MGSETSLPQVINIPALPLDRASAVPRVLAYARSVTVTDNASYEVAAEELRGVKAQWKYFEDTRVSFTEDLNKTVKRINDWFRAPLADLKAAAEVIGKTMITYQTEVERQAAEERARAEAEARRIQDEANRRAREEQAKADAEARRQREEAERQARLADEAARQAREARERGDRAAAAAAEKTRREAEEAERKAVANADKAVAKGEEKVSAIFADADSAPVAQVVTETPKASGTSARSTWSAEVFDVKALIAAVAAGTVPQNALVPDMKVLNGVARSLKDQMNYPGVRAVEDRGITSRQR